MATPGKLPIRARIYYFFASHLRILRMTLEFIPARRAWHLAPIIVLLVLVGMLIFASSNPAVSPFLYALF